MIAIGARPPPNGWRDERANVGAPGEAKRAWSLRTLPLALGAAHGIADTAAGLVVFPLPLHLPIAEAAALVVLYNALAFAGQLLLAAAVDRGQRPRPSALGGLALLAVGLVLTPGQPWLAVICAGLGSAAFHVGAGALALESTPGRARGPAWFTAPGVLGFGVAGALVAAECPAVGPSLALVALAGGALAVWQMPPQAHRALGPAPLFTGQEAALLSLLLAIGLRSAVWNTMPLLVQGDASALLALALAAAAGKSLGGVLADRLGWRRWSLGALLGAAVLLAASDARLVLLVPGVALLQSAQPVALAAAGWLLPQRSATAAALVLGVGIAAGSLAAFGGFSGDLSDGAGLGGAAGLAGLGYWWALRRVRAAEPRVAREHE